MHFKAGFAIGLTLFLVAALVKPSVQAEASPNNEGEDPTLQGPELAGPAPSPPATGSEPSKPTDAASSSKTTKLTAKVGECIEFEAAVKLHITYQNSANQNTVAQFELKQQEGSSPTGSCKEEERATVDFVTQQGWNLGFEYTYVKESKEYHLSGIKYKYTVDAANFPDFPQGSSDTREFTKTGLNFFPTSIGKHRVDAENIKFALGSETEIEIGSYNTKVFLKPTPVDGGASVTRESGLPPASNQDPPKDSTQGPKPHSNTPEQESKKTGDLANQLKANVTGCLEFEAAIKLTVKYLNSTNQNSTAQFDLKQKEGSSPVVKCGEKVASLAFVTQQGWNLAIVYKNDSNKYHISNIILDYTVNATNFADVGKDTNTTHKAIASKNLALFPTPIGKTCSYEQNVSVPLDSNTELKIESYNAKVFLNSTTISEESGECEKGVVPSLEPKDENTKNHVAEKPEVAKLKGKGKDKDKVCFDFEAVVKLHIEYQNNKTENSTAQFELKQQEGIKPTGKCDNKFASLTFTTEQGWKLHFQYVREPNKKYYISGVKLDYTVNATNLPDDIAKGFSRTNKTSIGNLTLLPTPIDKKCAYGNKIEFPIDPNVVIEIDSYNTKVFPDSTPIPGPGGDCTSGTFPPLIEKKPPVQVAPPAQGGPAQGGSEKVAPPVQVIPPQNDPQAQLPPVQDPPKNAFVGSEPLTRANETGDFASFLAQNISAGEGCPKLDIKLTIAINYTTKDNKTSEKEFNLDDPSFTRVCDRDMKINSLHIHTKNGWELSLVYSVALNDTKVYRLSRVSLNYTVDEKTFEDVSPSLVGSQYASTPAGYSAYSTGVSSSYKCTANNTIQLGDQVSLQVSYYQGQPFVTKDAFDTAVECRESEAKNCTKFGIYVGVSLVVLVVAILVIFKLFKNRPGFQRVSLGA